MKKILFLITLVLFPFFVEAKEIDSIWIFVPDESQTIEYPWRIIIYDDSSVVSHVFFFGCKREFGTDLMIVDEVIEIKFPERDSIFIRKEGHHLVFRALLRITNFQKVQSGPRAILYPILKSS